MPFRLKTSHRKFTLMRCSINSRSLKTYRLGLVIIGAFWVLIASSLSGCAVANGWVKNQSGRMYYRQGNYVAARSEFERALMDNPYRASYAYNVAKTMEKQGDTSGAEDLYSHALALNPSHRPTYGAYSKMLTEQGRTDDARQLLTAWSTTQPYSTRAKIESAKVERSAGNMQGAEQQYAAALNQGRFNPAVRSEVRSFLRDDLGRPDLAQNLMNYRSLSQNSYYQSKQNSGGMMSPSQHMAGYMPQVDSTVPTGITPVNHSYATYGNFGSQPMFQDQGGFPVEMSPMMMDESGMPMQQNYGPTPLMAPGMPQGMDLQLPGEISPTPAAPQGAGVQQGDYHQAMPMDAMYGSPNASGTMLSPQFQQPQTQQPWGQPPQVDGIQMPVPSPYPTGSSMPVQPVGWSGAHRQDAYQAAPLYATDPNANQNLISTPSF